MTIPTLRKQLRSAAQREPQSIQTVIKTLDIQLRNFERGDPDEKAALRPEIETSVRKIEAACCGR